MSLYCSIHTIKNVLAEGCPAKVSIKKEKEARERDYPPAAGRFGGIIPCQRRAILRGAYCSTSPPSTKKGGSPLLNQVLPPLIKS